MFDNILKMKDLYNEKGYPPSPPSHYISLEAFSDLFFILIFPCNVKPPAEWYIYRCCKALSQGEISTLTNRKIFLPARRRKCRKSPPVSRSRNVSLVFHRSRLVKRTQHGILS